MKQLTLPFLRPPDYAAEDFCAAPSNVQAREWLNRPDAWSNDRLVLWGPAGCGKTHLLHSWAAAHQAEIFSGAALRGLPPPPQGPVAIDDSDMVFEPQALLHLLNAAAEAGQPVLLAARQPPARQDVPLADLSSRLRAAQAVEIRGPEDELLDMLLTRLAAERQLHMPIAVRNFLLTRLPRTAAALREAVARLDRAAAASNGKVTRGMAADILNDTLEDCIECDTKMLLTRHSLDTEALL